MHYLPVLLFCHLSISFVFQVQLSTVWLATHNGKLIIPVLIGASLIIVIEDSILKMESGTTDHTRMYAAVCLGFLIWIQR
ncbi:MAG: hypothetical protein EBT09_00605 [Actinobacteria bacterium]|nr:hypothetical protein [Actinomycetota bacterium]